MSVDADRHATAPRLQAWAGFRLVGAVAILVAVGAQLALTWQNTLVAGTPHGSHLPTVLTNFFSFFTVLSNVSSATVLLIAAGWGLAVARRGTLEPRGLGVALACVSTYMIVTGIVYNTLLRGIELPQGQTLAWSNEVLHVVGPLVLLADVLFAPGRRRLPWGTLRVVVAFPILWVVYTLVRANFVTSPGTGDPWWYPYPFLDPHLVPGEYLGVAGYVAGIAVAILAVAAGVLWVGRRRGGVG